MSRSMIFDFFHSLLYSDIFEKSSERVMVLCDSEMLRGNKKNSFYTNKPKNKAMRVRLSHNNK